VIVICYSSANPPLSAALLLHSISDSRGNQEHLQEGPSTTVIETIKDVTTE
jgi:hypothetical protein